MRNFLSRIAYHLVLLACLPASAASLTPGAPVEITGTHGKFDFIKIDATNRRLLACHTQNGSLDVIDLDSGKLLQSIPTGNAQGVAIDDKGGRYFVSASKPTQMAIIDAKTLAVTGVVPLPGAVDVMAYSATLNRAFVCNDDKPILWEIDPEAKSIVATLNLPGKGMEDLGFNADGSFLFQNLKDTNALAKIDPVKMTVVNTWPTAPAEKPHGLAVALDANVILIAGGNGKLIMVDPDSGAVLASADIAPRVDEIAYDPGLQHVYCASGTGTISVVSVGLKSLGSLGNVPSSPGAHSIAVDPKTHTVWIAYAKDDKAYVQPFTAQ